MSDLSLYFRQDKIHEGDALARVVAGLAESFMRFDNLCSVVMKEYDIRQTEQLIRDWETTVGIPDTCFKTNVSLEQRRAQVLLKLAGINATTRKQIAKVAQILGFDVDVDDVVDGFESSAFPVTLPFVLMSPAETSFYIVVRVWGVEQPQTLPLTLPFKLGQPPATVLECVITRLIPANTKIRITYPG